MEWLRSGPERERARMERVLSYGRITDKEPRPDHPGEYLAAVKHPPDYLSDDALDIFDWLGMADRPKIGDQLDLIRDRARPDDVPFVGGFQVVCWLELGEWPSSEAVRAEIDLRS